MDSVIYGRHYQKCIIPLRQKYPEYRSDFLDQLERRGLITQMDRSLMARDPNAMTDEEFTAYNRVQKKIQSSWIAHLLS